MPYDDTTARTIIRHLVNGGFHAPADVAQILTEETFEPGALTADDRARLVRAVNAAFATKLEAEQSWPEETDWDRLNQAFEDLTDDHDILTLHANGMTQSDMWDDTLELADAMKADGFTMLGACFYHYQDVENAVDGHGLHLTFGPIGDASPLTPVAIGRLVVDALKAHGFAPVWDGTEQSRIQLPIDWKKRHDPEDEEDDADEDEDGDADDA